MSHQLPWIAIPRFPQAGQPYAFANRSDEVSRLYRGVVAAGNAVRADMPTLRHRGVVSGYKGVGKSSLILQVLGMLRDPDGIVAGQRLALTSLPEPENRERWLILSVSGKQAPSVTSIADALQKSVISVLEDVGDEAERAAPNTLAIGWHHRLFGTQESQLFAEVKSALATFSLMIDFVRAWQGSRMKESVESSTKQDITREIEAFFQGQLSWRGIRPSSREGLAAMRLSAKYVRKWASTAAISTSMQRETIISADLVTDALNAFFATTDKAGIPTILVLDDFDEFASNVGPSHAERSAVLASVAGTFNQLRPTSLIIGIREEYMHEDVFRQFETYHVPPLSRKQGGDALEAWARVQQPPLSRESVTEIRAIGDRLLQPFDVNAPVVIPFRFLQVVAWLVNNPEGGDETDHARILRYIRSSHNGEAYRAMKRLVALMPDEDVELCAEAVPLDAEPYQLSPRDRRALISAGLLRPAMAGDTEDTRIVIDPLAAYLRATLVEP